MTDASGDLKRPVSRRSALASVLQPGRYGAVRPGDPGVRLAERHPLSMVQIEARDDGLAALLDQAEEILGVRPPMTFGGTAGDGQPRILWSGPRRWLVVEPHGRDLFQTLRPGLTAPETAVVDLSSGRSAFRLSGLNARDVLAKGTSIDTHPDKLGSNRVAMTSLFHISVLIDCREANATVPIYDLYAARGYAVALWESLTDAAAEYGYAVDG